MKRLLFFILSLLYLLASTGTTMKLHFCRGELAGWSLWSNDEKSTCDMCETAKKKSCSNGCCTDEHKWVKIHDDQKTNTFLDCLNFQAVAPGNFYSTHSSYFHDKVVSLPRSNAPPPMSDVPVYKRHCVFRI